MKGDISLKIIDEVACPFCPKKYKEHSWKNLKRHMHKLHGAAVGVQKMLQDFQNEFGKLQLILMAYKKKFGDIKEEELNNLCQELRAELANNMEEAKEQSKEDQNG